MYQVICKLELTKWRLRCWNWEVLGDIFEHLEKMEASIMDLQAREDQGDGLTANELADLKGKLAAHHSLLW